MNKIDSLIKKLDLKPHPEGGYFRETYRSSGEINSNNLGSNYSGKRNYSTCIFFLLRSEDFSAFHKINQDEIWHLYDGSALCLHIISEAGVYSQHIVGKDFSNGESPQVIVPGNHWFAASVVDKNSYTLVGCTVSPGFDFQDFILPNRNELLSKFPQHAKIITKLTLPAVQQCRIP